MKRIHKINTSINKESFVYHPSTHSLFKTSPIVSEILEKYYNEKQSVEDIALKYKIDPGKIKETINKFDVHIETVKAELSKKKENVSEQPNSIEVKVNVSHICNLRCLYCYALDGSYGQKGLMDREIAESTVHFLKIA